MYPPRGSRCNPPERWTKDHCQNDALGSASRIARSTAKPEGWSRWFGRSHWIGYVEEWSTSLFSDNEGHVVHPHRCRARRGSSERPFWSLNRRYQTGGMKRAESGERKCLKSSFCFRKWITGKIISLLYIGQKKVQMRVLGGCCRKGRRTTTTTTTRRNQMFGTLASHI